MVVLYYGICKKLEEAGGLEIERSQDYGRKRKEIEQQLQASPPNGGLKA